MNASGDLFSSYAVYYKNHVPMQANHLIKTIIFAFTFLATNVINGMLILIYFKHPVFHESSRYVLFIHLLINDVLELSTALLLYIWLDYQPFLLVPLCYFFLILADTFTMNMPINLAMMALERYVAICFPLHHSRICSLQWTYLAIGLIWLVGLIPSITDLLVVLGLESPSFFHTSILCIRESLLRSPRQVDSRLNLLSSYLSVVWLIVVLTYLRIVLAARSVSSSEKTSARKARNTVLLHGVQLLLVMVSYLSPVFEQLLLTVPASMRSNLNFIKFYLMHVIPRALTPIVYGLRDENFKKHLKVFFQKRIQPSDVTAYPSFKSRSR